MQLKLRKIIREDKQLEQEEHAKEENSEESEDTENKNNPTENHRQFEQHLLSMLMNMGSNDLSYQREQEEQREKEMIEKAIQESLKENPNPDVMNYEQLQELEEQIGSVSKGFSDMEISMIPSKMNYLTKDDCSICLEKIKVAEQIKTLSCGHDFHTDCIDLSLKSSKKCPCCLCEHQISS